MTLLVRGHMQKCKSRDSAREVQGRKGQHKCKDRTQPCAQGQGESVIAHKCKVQYSAGLEGGQECVRVYWLFVYETQKRESSPCVVELWCGAAECAEP